MAYIQKGLKEGKGMFNLHLGLEAAGAVQVIGGRGLTRGQRREDGFKGCEPTGLRDPWNWGCKGKESVGALRFLDPTAA